jgi:predicted regulator of Ras-like GTPase activity (Roadblock/LC7/MglB family)
MFLERLNSVASRIDGAMALALVGADGIPVESVCANDSIDLEMLAAELIAQVRAISNNHYELSVGPVRQLAVRTDRQSLLVSALTPHYYLLLVLGPGVGIGRARFELVRARLLFEQDLD